VLEAGVGTTVSDFVIANNYVLTCPTGIAVINGGAGGVVRGVAISANRVAGGSGSTGIQIDTGATSINATGNNLYDCDTAIKDNSTYGAILSNNAPLAANLVYGGSVSSADNIAVRPGQVLTITGATTINHLNLTSSGSNGAGTTVTLIPGAGATWATGTSGNIGKSSTSVVGKSLTLTWDGSTWWPNY
jgi:hypothetical protein